MYKLQKLINDLQLEQHISLMNEMPHREVLKLMQQSKVFLHTSSYEGFGVVCLEALYAGAQVVSYCKPMHADFEHHHIVKSQEDMRKKLLELLDNKKLNHDSVLTWPIEESCKKILSLYS